MFQAVRLRRPLLSSIATPTGKEMSYSTSSYDNGQKSKTIENWRSLVVTDPTTTQSAYCLWTGDRTGTSVFSSLWSIAKDTFFVCVYDQLCRVIINIKHRVPVISRDGQCTDSVRGTMKIIELLNATTSTKATAGILVKVRVPV